VPKRIYPILFALALVAAACGLRWPGLGKTIWNLDEGSTFTMAEIVRDGGVLYRDAADNRTPLVPYVKALILSVVGDWNIRGAHIVVAIMLGLTAVWLWRLGRRCGDGAAGAMGAIYFTFLSFIMLDPADTMAAHTGWFLVFFSALGMWAFVSALARTSGFPAFLAGTAFALAALAKQPGVLDWGVCLVLCALFSRTTPERRRDGGRLAGMLALGFIWPLLATYGYFAVHGAWSDLVEYAWTYNTKFYVPEVPFGERLLGIRTPLQLAKDNAPVAFGLGVAAAFWLLARALPDLWRRRTPEFNVLPWLILGWTASGLASTVLSGRTFAHYSIQVLPGLSLACGWITVRLWESTGRWRAIVPRLGGWVIRAGLAAGLLGMAWAAIHRGRTFDLSDGISRDIGLVIKERTAPTDRIFVWGYEPELHVFSERLPNTRFVYSVFLTGLIPWTNLDARKNTDYAIVPGSWDAFWHDFTRRPPAMIVDTHGNRGFLKYPLRKQTRLWEIIEKEYAEVAVDYASARGYSLYQRASAAPAAEPAMPPAGRPLPLSAPAQCPSTTVGVETTAPNDTTAVDLYVDGRPYRRIENHDRKEVQVSFFLVGSDLAPGEHGIQVVARSANGDMVSSVHKLTVVPKDTVPPHFDGPALTFAGREITPVESETMNGRPVSLWGDNGQWAADAPSRLVYPRPEGLNQLEFTFGMRPGSYDGSNPQKTDGVDVTVYFEDKTGWQIELYHRRVDPVARAEDRTLVTGHAALPGLSGGKIILLVTPGPMNNPAFDWFYWRRISGDAPFIDCEFRGRRLVPAELEAELGTARMDFRGQKVELMHAPSHFAFRQVPGMTNLSGQFGMLDESWQGPQQSNGALFEIEQILPDATHKMLFARTLFPANKPDDRGLQGFQIPLPFVEGSLIRLSTRAADPANNSFNYTFWSGLKVAEFSAHLLFEGREILSLHSEAVNGLNYLGEGGETVLFAHAPSQVVFPLEAGARRLEGTIGIVSGAYTDKGKTDGVVFVVELESSDGARRGIFRRYLNPRDNPGDRGGVPFTVDLPELPAGRLILRTECAPSGRLDFAWSYWGRLQLTP